MKTVMKKIFSLMLVAVLLVSAVPAAFAEAVPCEHNTRPYRTETCSLCGQTVAATTDHDRVPATCTTPSACTICGSQTGSTDDNNHNWNGGEITTPATCTSEGVKTFTCTYNSAHTYTEPVAIDSTAHKYDSGVITTAPTCTDDGVKTFTCAYNSAHAYTEPVDATGHAYDAGVITKAATCSSTGIKTFTCANNASHTYTEEIAIDPNAHTFSGGKCKDCGKCQFCGNIGSHPENCLYYCNGTTNCPNDPTVPSAHNEGCLKTKCNKNGCTLAYGHTGECSVPCTVTAGCVLKQGHTGACNTPCTFTGCTLGYQHTGDHSNACAICGLPKIKSPEHKANCAYYYVNAEPEATPGDSDLEIWVNLHTANVETKTRLLTTYKDLSADTLIYEFISDRRDDIDDMLVDYYGKDYDWSGHVYTSAKADHALKTTAKLGEGAAVYINAYTYQDLVYIYVHTNRSYSNDRVILFEGKQIGDTISRKEVAAAVGKYYSVSSLRMYDEDDWKKVVQGRSVDARDNLKVTEEPFHIDVLISGSSIAGSGYTADSTNPKTGDMIMAPAIIMCASFGALATLFYLNKKRAI